MTTTTGNGESPTGPTPAGTQEANQEKDAALALQSTPSSRTVEAERIAAEARAMEDATDWKRRCSEAIESEDPTSAKYLSVTDGDLKHFFAAGRRNELVIEKKIEGADTLAVLVGFLLAFMIDNILSLDPETFNSDRLFNVFAVFLTLTACSGLYCSIVLAFLSVKVRRLLGKTIYEVGTDEDLPFKQGSEGIESSQSFKRMRGFMMECSVSEKEEKTNVRLSAKKWYSENGKQLYLSSLKLFVVFLVSFAVSACVKLADTLDTVVGYICMGMLVLTMITALIFLSRSEALHGLG